MKYVCEVCGYVYDGEIPFEEKQETEFAFSFAPAFPYREHRSCEMASPMASVLLYEAVRQRLG